MYSNSMVAVLFEIYLLIRYFNYMKQCFPKYQSGRKKNFNLFELDNDTWSTRTVWYYFLLAFHLSNHVFWPCHIILGSQLIILLTWLYFYFFVVLLTVLHLAKPLNIYYNGIICIVIYYFTCVNVLKIWILLLFSPDYFRLKFRGTFY